MKKSGGFAEVMRARALIASALDGNFFYYKQQMKEITMWEELDRRRRIR